MSRYFKPEEFWCRCPEPACPAQKDVHPTLLLKLDAMRERFARPLTVTSGIRCPAWNAKQGGKPDSEHLTGEGADLACPNSADRWLMIQAALTAGFRRLGVGKTFLHVGVSTAHDQDVIWTYYP